ncbi:hypothetical protein [Niallia sp. Man26]|uniref:hypothetical protein n=1 Tax=Niallia sp. Man26 TaxID=2912824 RepID=UPI001EDC75EF|nr:hypothetical protein [Niallia sp. Man26]UPO88338.1 hypothetical protein L8T27_003995 [Niallia sp. Man26]
MEKTVMIDGKQVQFKSNGATPLKYKMQFRKDFFAEILKLHKLGKLKNLDEIDDDVLGTLDFEVFYNIAWTFAKTADSSLPDPETWLESFNEFPIFDFISELQEMIMANIQSKKK